jgi:hypothetical protein
MGAYHFFLPWQFQWSSFMRRVPQPISWALISVNFFFSFLLLAGGILSFVALRAFRRSNRCDHGILIAMAAFWLANSLYQIFVPMPLPAQLWLLRIALLGFAIAAVLAYVVSVLAMRAAKDSTAISS